MENIVAQQKALSQEQEGAGCLFELCHCLNLVPIPLKPKSKGPLQYRLFSSESYFWVAKQVFWGAVAELPGCYGLSGWF